jgi:hypothetical protein
MYCHIWIMARCCRAEATNPPIRVLFRRTTRCGSQGSGFSLTSGEPVSWQRNQLGATWYEFAYAYVGSK